MKCYREDTEYVIKNVMGDTKSLDLIFIYIAIPSAALYLLLPDLFFFSGLFLFMATFNALLFIGFRLYSIPLRKDRMNYSFITKICVGDSLVKLKFRYSKEIVIHVKDIIYILPPKNRIGEIGYVLKKGKKRMRKDLMLSPELFNKVSKTIIQYFKKTKERPPFLVVLPDERAAMRNTLAWVQTYAVQNKKEKLDKILNDFWSKHKLEEFE